MNNFKTLNRYYIEPNNFYNGWVLRKEGSNNVLKKAKYKLMLICFAEEILSLQPAELRIFDSNGMIEEIVDFSKKLKK